MASSSRTAAIVPVSSNDVQPIQENGMEFVSEPTPEIETCKIWEKQVLIPHLLCSEQLAFAGPFPPLSNFNDEVKEIFPRYATCEPRAFVNSTYNMSYMEPRHRVFRLAPSTSKSYIEWLDKVQAKFGESWRQYDIFYLIQLSRECPKYHPEMLLAALHFWDSSTSTFQFKAGMLTPTLLDVAAITGLRPTGPSFDPTYASSTHNFAYTAKTYSKYIQEQYVTKSAEVTDHEHIAFLTYWLSQFIFCTGSLQVVTRLIPLAIQIHEGRNFSFGKLLLASLYHSLIDGSDNLKSYDKPSNKDKLTMAGPIWLLQLWLNATFASNLNLTISPVEESKVAKRNIEASRLALFQQKTPGLNSPKELFQFYFNIFLSLDKFKPENFPFITRRIGPSWLTQDFPATDPNKEPAVNELWLAFLSPSILSSRLGVQRAYLGLVGYQPNLVARLFGLSQFMPKSLFKNKDDIVLGNSETIMQQVNAGLDALQLTSKRKASSSTPSVSTASESRKRQNSPPPTTKKSKKTKQDSSKPASVEEQQDKDIDSPIVAPITQGETDKGKHPATVEPQTKSTTGPPEKKKKKERKRAKIRQLILEDEEDDQEETSTQQVQPTQTIPTSTTEVPVVIISPDVVNIPLSKGESTNSCLADSNPKDTTLLPESTKERSPPKASNVEKGPSEETPVVEIQNPDAVSVETGVQDNPTAEESRDSSSSEQTASQEETYSTSGEEENSTEDTADNTAFDDEAIKEAEEGGDDILPVSSTSKLSADIGFEGTQSNSSLQSTDSRQAALMAKLQTDFVEQDVLQAIEANPATAFSYLAFLKKLQNPLTDRSIQVTLNRLEFLIGNYATAYRNKVDSEARLKVRQENHANLLKKASAANETVEQLQKEVDTTSHSATQEQDQNISKWEQHVANLKLQIEEYEKKIAAEKVKRKEKLLAATSNLEKKIAVEAKKGIDYFSAFVAVDGEVQTLVETNDIMGVELATYRRLYEELKASL
ncbi:hypothetical protein TSUD_405500 [Trifolium subterraneum]|uniref:Aminotransferase-like plant mobile domain-containing protein n=1 Tax=Trifolium subterraneum TaxID=3900 RepID=A0A2Z6PDE1_TRISU|nr:hypothetical protein TSUD_405500 [Trifolium subterraneum]